MNTVNLLIRLIRPVLAHENLKKILIPASLFGRFMVLVHISENVFHFSQDIDLTRVILSVNIHTTCTMVGYRVIIIQILEGNIKFQIILGDT